jgi:hypothetical protein
VIVNDKMGAQLTDDLCHQIGIQPPFGSHQKVDGIEIGRKKGNIRTKVASKERKKAAKIVSIQKDSCTQQNSNQTIRTFRLKHGSSQL